MSVTAYTDYLSTCYDCGEECRPMSNRRLVADNLARTFIGYLCDGCYADTVETTESLRARGDYPFSDGGA